MSTKSEQRARIFDYYNSWDGQRTYVHPATVIRTLQQRRLPQHARILDIGFGNGEIALAVARKWPHGHISGIDFTPHNVQMARAKAQTAGLQNISFRVDDAETWQASEASYHAIYAMQLMQFIHQPHDLLRRIFAALKPTGALLFATPFLPPQARLHPFFMDAYSRVIPNSFQYRTENAWFTALFDIGFQRIYVAKAHWEPSTQPPAWQQQYHAARQIHGIEIETARRNTWGGIISARKPAKT
jgi:ubiquinone/menaquinone biosynthesis C-methylase UbiE